MKFTKVYISVVLSTFTLLSYHHHYSSQKLLPSYSTATPHPLDDNSPFSSFHSWQPVFCFLRQTFKFFCLSCKAVDVCPQVDPKLCVYQTHTRKQQCVGSRQRKNNKEAKWVAIATLFIVIENSNSRCLSVCWTTRKTLSCIQYILRRCLFCARHFARCS